MTRCLTRGSWRDHLLRIAAAVRHGDRPWRGQDDLAQIDQCRRLVRDTFGAKLYRCMLAELLSAVERSLLPLFSNPAGSSIPPNQPVDEPFAAADAGQSAAMAETDDIPF